MTGLARALILSQESGRYAWVIVGSEGAVDAYVNGVYAYISTLYAFSLVFPMGRLHTSALFLCIKTHTHPHINPFRANG